MKRIEKYKNKVTLTKDEFAKLYKSMTQQKLAEKLGVSQPCVCYHAKKFGLSKTREKRLHFK